MYDTGDISLIQSLDYEQNKEEHFMVKAVFSDGVISVAEVIIYVLDVNDECPSFTSSSTTIYVTEPTRAGTYVTKATITDRDTDPVNRHAFALSGDNMFQIDANTGVITFKSFYESSRKVNILRFLVNVFVYLIPIQTYI